MSDIYNQFDRAFARIDGYSIIDAKGRHVGRVAFKHTDAAATCFFQIWGAPMVKGRAPGGGYDRKGAAFASAAAKLDPSHVLDPHLRTAAVYIGAHARDGAGPGWEAVKRDLESLKGVRFLHVFG